MHHKGAPKQKRGKKEEFRKLEQKLLSEIKSFYGKRLISFVVFGSAARETQRFNSDIDILIIAKGLSRGRMKRIREFDAVEKRIGPFLNDLQKEGINTYISAIIKTPEEAISGSPLFLDMVEDAKILFDKNGFFSNIIERLKSRLKELGAKRIWLGNAWYWILRTGSKLEEVFE